KNPGVGALNYGVTFQNAGSMVSKLRGEFIDKGVTSGGNERQWELLSRWGSTPQAKGVDQAQLSLWNKFLSTGGEVPKGLDPQIPYNALDWSYREIGRQDQHKTSFLQDVLSSPITSIAIGALTGGIGAFGSAALAGASAAAAGGSILGATAAGAGIGALTGAATHYGTSLVLDKLKPPGETPVSVAGAAPLGSPERNYTLGGNGANSPQAPAVLLGGGPSARTAGPPGAPLGMGFGGTTKAGKRGAGLGGANVPMLLGA
ncbi:MAG: hypothetical protein ABL879_15465, partial [Devosia sp.]